MKAFEHSEVYFNVGIRVFCFILRYKNNFFLIIFILHLQLICSLDPKLLRLTPHDDTIYEKFRSHFPDFNVDILNVETLKSSEAKEVSMIHSSIPRLNQGVGPCLKNSSTHLSSLSARYFIVFINGTYITD